MKTTSIVLLSILSFAVSNCKKSRNEKTDAQSTGGPFASEPKFKEGRECVQIGGNDYGACMLKPAGDDEKGALEVFTPTEKILEHGNFATASVTLNNKTREFKLDIVKLKGKSYIIYNGNDCGTLENCFADPELFRNAIMADAQGRPVWKAGKNIWTVSMSYTDAEGNPIKIYNFQDGNEIHVNEDPSEYAD